MVNALILLIIIIAAGYGCFWFIDQGAPEPIKWVAKLLVALLGVLAILQYVMPAAGIAIR